MLSLVLNEVVPPPPPQPPQPASADTAALAPKFPGFLLPSFTRPFRRLCRRSSPSTTAPAASNAIPAHRDVSSLGNSPSGLLRLSGPADLGLSASSSSPHNPTDHPDVPRLTKIQPDTIRCSTCGADLAFHSQIVSKGFTGRYGRAYLVSPPDCSRQKPGAGGPNLMNIKVGKPEQRTLVTGAHTVSDIQCAICRARIGWKYVDAKEDSQKYKIGKFILETRRTVDHRNWEDITPDEVRDLGLDQMDRYEDRSQESIVFDSGDEDECEDLFAGVWNAKTAAKRRKRKAGKKK